jgi:hypothetical protein
MTTMAGMLHDRYLRGALLGAGGMGEVFEGYDRLLARRVAIKVLVYPYGRDPVFLARFEREAQAAAGLGHPNIVNVFDIGEQDGLHFMVMEHVDGRTLRELLDAEVKVKPERAADIGIQVCAALTAAHERGIVHRDVKPSNIMLTADDTVKVMDFGLAVAATWEHITTPSAVLGTAKYISPEHAKRDAVDARSDVYSLGVCLYELLTGHAPFEGLIPVAIVYCHVNEEPPPPRSHDPSIPAELEAVVLRAMAKDPDHRYQTADALRADLELILAGLPPLAVTEPVTPASIRFFPVSPDPVDPEPAAGGPPAAGPWPAEPDPASWRPEPEGAAEHAPPRRAEPGDQHQPRPAAPGRPVAAPPRRPPSRRKVISLAALSGALLALVVVAVYMVVTRSGAQDMAIAVPDVRGLRAADAVADLRGRGFIDVRLPTRSDTRSATLIVSQDPAPGAVILPAQPITLTVAGPRPRVRVPRVAGLPPDQAAARLRQADLDVRADNAWRDDPVIAPNRVIGTVPEPGALIEAGSSVQLVVSLGNGVDDPGSSTAPTVTP